MSEEEKDTIYLLSYPKYVGGWQLPGSTVRHTVQFNMEGRPCWLHRTMMRLLLGWKWKDEK